MSADIMMSDKIVQEASHAWAEVHLDGLGWVGFDISNGISPDEKYIKLATGFDYHDVVPLSGIRHGSGNEKLITSILLLNNSAEIKIMSYCVALKLSWFSIYV